MTKKTLKQELISNSRKKHLKKSLPVKWFNNRTWWIKTLIITTFSFIVIIAGLFCTYRYQKAQAINHLKKDFAQPVLIRKKINPRSEGKTTTNDVKNVTPATLVKLHEKAIELGYEKDLIGKLSIPKIGIKQLPVYQGMNQYTLALGAATYCPKARIYRKGNFIIAAHNMTPEKLLFTNLGTLKKGDKIEFSNGVAKYIYVVDAVRHRVNPYQTTIQGKPVVGSIFYNNLDKRYMTLFTCEDAKGETRTVVTANFKKINF